ncbi:MAG: hypothetical protein ACRC0L_11990 [Angustibacter sp.]
MKVYEHDFPGRLVRLESQTFGANFSQEEVAEAAIEAISLFCENFILPLTTDLVLGFCDAEFLYPGDSSQESSYFLRDAELPFRVGLISAWENAREERVGGIDPAIILDWILRSMRHKGASSEGLNSSKVVCLQEILVRSTEVRLPHLANIDRDELDVGNESRSIAYPIVNKNGERYVHGPMTGKTIDAPIKLKINSDLGVLTMDINIFWSLWTDPQSEGWRQVRDAVERISSAGWTCTRSQIEELCL